MDSNIVNDFTWIQISKSGLQITCPIIVLTQIIDDLKNEVEKLELTSENCYLDILNKVLSSLKKKI